MLNLATLTKRLEAVTARLEDIAAAAEASGTVASSADLSRTLPSLIQALAPPQARDDTVPSETQVGSETLPQCIEEFDGFLQKSVGPYVRLSNELGGAVARQAAAVLTCFQEQRRILMVASIASKPDASGWQDLIRPMNDAAARVVEIQENSHGDSMHNHLSCVADGIPVLGWIGIEMRAFRHVDTFLGYTQYFGNKVTKEHKETNPKHVEWVESYYQIFRDLSSLIQDQFPLGISWRVDP